MNLFGIILNSTDLGLLAIAGACLAWFVPHRLSVSRERRARCVAACANFRAAFNADISEISSPARLPDIYVYLAKGSPRMTLLFESFPLMPVGSAANA